jgi:hypothetical protein
MIPESYSCNKSCAMNDDEEEQEDWVIEAVHSISISIPSNHSSNRGISPRNSISSIPSRGANRFSRFPSNNSTNLPALEEEFLVLDWEEKDFSSEENSAVSENALKNRESRFSSAKGKSMNAQSIKRIGSNKLADAGKRKGSSSSSVSAGKESADSRFRKFKKGEHEKTKLTPVLKKIESDSGDYKFSIEFIAPSYDDLSKASESSNSSELDSKGSTPSPTPLDAEVSVDPHEAFKRKAIREKKKMIRSHVSDPKESKGMRADIDRLSMKEIARNDIIQSEEVYFNQLQVLLNEYLSEIEKSRDEIELTSREVSILQSNVADLYEFHRSCIEEVLNDPGNIIEVFHSRIDFLKLYVQYLNGFEQVTQVLSSQSTNSAFCSFLRNLKSKSSISSLSFITLLKIPLDRASFYELSFRELKRFSLPQDSDFIMLQQVYDKIQRSSSFIAENLFEFEQLMYLLDIDFGLKNKERSGFNLISPLRFVLSKQF